MKMHEAIVTWPPVDMSMSSIEWRRLVYLNLLGTSLLKWLVYFIQNKGLRDTLKPLKT